MDAGAVPAARTRQCSSRTVEHRQSLVARTGDGTRVFGRGDETWRSTHCTQPHHGHRWVVAVHGGKRKRTSSWRSGRKGGRPTEIQRQTERSHRCFEQTRRVASPTKSIVDALGRRNHSHRLSKK